MSDVEDVALLAIFLACTEAVAALALVLAASTARSVFTDAASPPSAACALEENANAYANAAIVTLVSVVSVFSRRLNVARERRGYSRSIWMVRVMYVTDVTENEIRG